MDRIFVVEKLRIPIFSVIMSDLLSQDTSFQNVLTNIPITPLECKFSIALIRMLWGKLSLRMSWLVSCAGLWVAQETRLAHVYLNIAKLLVNSTVSIPFKEMVGM